MPETFPGTIIEIEESRRVLSSLAIATIDLAVALTRVHPATHWSFIIFKGKSAAASSAAKRGHAYTESKTPSSLWEEIFEDPLYLDSIVVASVEDLMYLDLFGFGHCWFAVQVQCCLLDDEE
ncbi:hypothetical protein F52700_4474 [Fusarium sp. NRRL 52700]|nr:hypothetical protein F52700_4474 [Fusarium sp. NRRL 52700]